MDTLDHVAAWRQCSFSLIPGKEWDCETKSNLPVTKSGRSGTKLPKIVTNQRLQSAVGSEVRVGWVPRIESS